LTSRFPIPLAMAVGIGAAVVLLCAAFTAGGIYTGLFDSPDPETKAVATVQPLAVSPSSSASLEPAASPAEMIVVPSGVGLDYQSAQDLWRASGLLVLPATDATGAGRLPVIDANWVVLSQNPAAGTMVAKGSFITAAVKKYTD
jgi:hypothetical protein